MAVEGVDAASRGSKRQVDQSQQHPHMDGANLKIIWRQVTSIIISVCQQSQARPFLQPVDTARIKDYLDHVARPMDLGTIKKKLAAKAYGSPGQVLADVRLVFANCRAYNPPTEMVCKQGQELSEQFEHLWDKYSIDKRWQQLLDGDTKPIAGLQDKPGRSTATAADSSANHASPAVGDGTEGSPLHVNGTRGAVIAEQRLQHSAANQQPAASGSTANLRTLRRRSSQQQAQSTDAHASAGTIEKQDAAAHAGAAGVIAAPAYTDAKQNGVISQQNSAPVRGSSSGNSLMEAAANSSRRSSSRLQSTTEHVATAINSPDAAASDHAAGDRVAAAEKGDAPSSNTLQAELSAALQQQQSEPCRSGMVQTTAADDGAATSTDAGAHNAVKQQQDGQQRAGEAAVTAEAQQPPLLAPAGTATQQVTHSGAANAIVHQQPADAATTAHQPPAPAEITTTSTEAAGPGAASIVSALQPVQRAVALQLACKRQLDDICSSLQSKRQRLEDDGAEEAKLQEQLDKVNKQQRLAVVRAQASTAEATALQQQVDAMQLQLAQLQQQLSAALAKQRADAAAEEAVRVEAERLAVAAAELQQRRVELLRQQEQEQQEQEELQKQEKQARRQLAEALAASAAAVGESLS